MKFIAKLKNFFFNEIILIFAIAGQLHFMQTT